MSACFPQHTERPDNRNAALFGFEAAFTVVNNQLIGAELSCEL